MDGQQNQCNITDASPPSYYWTITFRYSDLESRFGPMQPRKPAQDTLSHMGEWNFVTFRRKVKVCCRTIIDLMFERHKQARWSGLILKSVFNYRCN